MKNIVKLCALVVFFFGCITLRNDPKKIDVNLDKQAIKNVLKSQENAWNKGDLKGFMKGYWQSDSLKFYSRNGLTKGWTNTLDNYKKGYSNKSKMGTLTFVVNDISQIENNSYWVMGEYHLKRTIGNTQGVFLIIFKLINGKWKIVADMSC